MGMSMSLRPRVDGGGCLVVVPQSGEEAAAASDAFALAPPAQPAGQPLGQQLRSEHHQAKGVWVLRDTSAPAYL